MPNLFLAPETSPAVVIGGDQQDWMKQIADAMEPYLTAANIQFNRGNIFIPDINAGNYDFVISLHSNSAPDTFAGKLRGITIYYKPDQEEGQLAATILANHLKAIYPLPDLVRTELIPPDSKAVNLNPISVFLELGYYDNPQDTLWIQNNIDAIAQNLSQSIITYFDAVSAQNPPSSGQVAVDWGVLNIREAPGVNAPILATATNGTPLTILDELEGWYQVQFGDTTGYVSPSYVIVDSGQ